MNICTAESACWMKRWDPVKYGHDSAVCVLPDNRWTKRKGPLNSKWIPISITSLLPPLPHCFCNLGNIAVKLAFWPVFYPFTTIFLGIKNSASERKQLQFQLTVSTCLLEPTRMQSELTVFLRLTPVGGIFFNASSGGGGGIQKGSFFFHCRLFIFDTTKFRSNRCKLSLLCQRMRPIASGELIEGGR